jgi:hypothetical protein
MNGRMVPSIIECSITRARGDKRAEIDGIQWRQ